MNLSEPLIRKMALADLDDLYALLSDSEVMRYIEPPFSKQQTVQFLMNAGLSDKPLIYAVEDRGSFIGYVIFRDYDEGNMEIGWILKREVWGQGYAGLLTKMLIDKSRRLGKGAIIECNPRQAVTKHIAKKHGFVFSGKRDGCDVYKLEESQMNPEIDISNVTLHTDRMILRPWRQTDLDDLYAYASVDGVGQMAGWKPHESKEESQKILDMFIDEKKTFALEYQGKVIGSLGIEKYNQEHFPEFADKKCREIGYVLSKEYWGRGLISNENARFQTSLFGRMMAFKTWTDRSIPFDIDTAAHPE